MVYWLVFNHVIHFKTKASKHEIKTIINLSTLIKFYLKNYTHTHTMTMQVKKTCMLPKTQSSSQVVINVKPILHESINGYPVIKEDYNIQR